MLSSTSTYSSLDFNISAIKVIPFSLSFSLSLSNEGSDTGVLNKINSQISHRAFWKTVTGWFILAHACFSGKCN